MKNKNLKTIFNSIIILCTSILLIFILCGALEYGFESRPELGSDYIWYDYINWEVMGFPVAITIVIGVLQIVKLFKCTVPQYKAGTNKSLGILTIFFDVLLFVGLILWVTALCIFPGLVVKVPVLGELSFDQTAGIVRSDEVINVTTNILVYVGISVMFVSSVMNPILSSKIQDK